MAQENFCPFYSKATSLECWDFDGPRGSGLQNKGGKWNFSSGTTPSNNTGPTEGHTHGYVYCESGSPTKVGSIFTMTSLDVFDASDSEIEVSYFYNCNTDAPVLLEVLGWNGNRWILEDQIQPEEHELGDEWFQRTFFIENYNNTDCKIRFRVTILEGGKTYRKDFALDTVIIRTSNGDTDGINTFFESKNIHKREKFDKKFMGKHKPKQEFDSILDEFKANINDFDFTKYPDGIVIEETPQIMHVFTEKDKD